MRIISMLLWLLAVTVAARADYISLYFPQLDGTSCSFSPDTCSIVRDNGTRASGVISSGNNLLFMQVIFDPISTDTFTIDDEPLGEAFGTLVDDVQLQQDAPVGSYATFDITDNSNLTSNIDYVFCVPDNFAGTGIEASTLCGVDNRPIIYFDGSTLSIAIPVLQVFDRDVCCDLNGVQRRFSIENLQVVTPRVDVGVNSNVDPIPEPGTWVLLVMGLGMLYRRYVG